MSIASIGSTALLRCCLAFALPLAALSLAGGEAVAAPSPVAAVDARTITDDALVATLPGFRRGFATVNGVRLHHVSGGKGDPVLLLPG
jgi:hypothetical protein